MARDVAPDPREHFHAWLRDAHAMEEQAISMLSAQIDRVGDYPVLQARLRQHLEETRGQVRDLHERLLATGTENSLLKDISAKLTAMAQGLSGMFAADEVIKGMLASYTFEQMEIASYRILVAAADCLGDPEAKAVFERNLAQEIDMARWLEDHMPDITRTFLAPVGADGQRAAG